MYKVKKTFEVAVAHKLTLPYVSKCRSVHGHNLIITVYCEADELNENGMVIDFTHIKEKIHDVIDHSCLSDIDCTHCCHTIVKASVKDLGNPTAENLARWIFMQIDKCYRVDVQESEGNVATYEVGL